MADRTTHTQVRQVLMNELGLTRESVRAEVRQIVVDTMERMLHGDNLQDMLERLINLRVREYWSSRESVRAAVDKASHQVVREEALKQIEGRLKVTLEP